MNSKTLLFSLAILMCYWSSTSADLVDAVRKQFPDYHGDVIVEGNKRHPTALCRKALESGLAFWANFRLQKPACSANILCKNPDPYGPTELSQLPEEGVILTVGGPYTFNKYFVCLKGEPKEIDENILYA